MIASVKTGSAYMGQHFCFLPVSDTELGFKLVEITGHYIFSLILKHSVVLDVNVSK